MRNWNIQIHKLVTEDDFKNISEHDQHIILKTIYKKLGTEPQKYGTKLHGDLKDYWKLKISHFRVVYRIDNNTVTILVLKIGMRRDEEVYKEMYSRIKKQKEL